MKFQPSKILAIFRGAIVTAWVYCGFILFLLTGGLVNLRRNKQFRRRAHGADTRPVNKPPVNRVSVSKPLPVDVKKTGLNGHAWPKPVFRRKRRKRVFNYSKFYMRVVKELSSHSHAPASTMKGTSPSNGHGHGDSHSHANGQPGGHTAPHRATVNQVVKSEIKELIAGQEILIQKQRSLLEQQATLIEEKNRIIEEQTAFLKMQSGLAADRRAAA